MSAADAPLPAEEARPVVFVVEMENEALAPVTAQFLLRAIRTAATERAAGLVIVLDTPGGLVDSTRSVVQGILRSEVPVVVFVAPRGARAASAGVFVTLAAHVAAMAPGTHIGAAHPVHTDPWGVKVSLVEVKHVDLPEAMKRAMARQAESERERRAKVIHAEGEFQAAARLRDAAETIHDHPMAMQMRFLQTVADIGSQNNTTILFPVPIELFTPFLRNGHAGEGPRSHEPEQMVEHAYR